MTELDVVNSMLATMGVHPLNSLSEDDDDVAVCRKIIREASLKVQKKSWWFNREEIDLVADTEGPDHFIYTPGDAIRCDPVVRTPGPYRVVQRGRRLYDTDRNTYAFPAGTRITCTLVRLIPFDDLPPSAKEVVSLYAVIKFQQSYDADNSKTNQLFMELSEANMDLSKEHIRNTKGNLLFKNSTAYTINRVNGLGTRFR